MITVMKAEKTELAELDDKLLEHAGEVLEEALRLRDKGVSYRILMRRYKPSWERQVYLLLKKFLGNVSLLGKDSGLVGQRNTEWLCICDPLDGSLNFMCNLKYYAYSLALARGGELVYAMVIDLEDMTYYRAEKGRGAYLGRPGKGLRSLKDEALKTPASYQVIANGVIIQGMSSIELHCTALELCYLARGVADLIVGHTWVPDMVAGYLIARESGIMFVDWDFKPIKSLPLSYEEVKYIGGSPKSIAEFHSKVTSLRGVVFNETASHAVELIHIGTSSSQRPHPSHSQEL
ncbi:MAG: hypothetical protein DRN15_06030 [Thermoprotei archaeon]|nr:MAG: hypothetical protein DRN15_06030 [Thermoprotei archaeon]RLF25010.1 MAG: hypothetical protein DRM97_02595 [Thermoprotei archaeon]